MPPSSAPCTTWAGTGPTSRCLPRTSSRPWWRTTRRGSRPPGRTGVCKFHCTFYTHHQMNSLTQVVLTILLGLLHRNVMVEAARFSHGQGATQMQDLSKLDVNSFDGIIFPGGHGVIKNLWGTLGSLLDHFELWTDRMVCWRWRSNIAPLISLDPLLRRMAKTASCMAMWRGCWRNSTVPASPLGMNLDETFQSVSAEWGGTMLEFNWLKKQRGCAVTKTLNCIFIQAWSQIADLHLFVRHFKSDYI